MIPKRFFWLTVGYGTGLATSLYVQRRVRHAVVRVTPPEVRASLQRRGHQTANRGRDVVGVVRLAFEEGRAGMREAEESLRATHALPDGAHGRAAAEVPASRR